MSSGPSLPYPDFDYAMTVRGWVQFDSFLSEAQCSRMRDDVTKHVGLCSEFQVKAGIPGAPDGTAHHSIGGADSLDELLEHLPLSDHVADFFGGPYVLHAFNPVTVQPGRPTYVHKIHRDAATHCGDFRLLMNMLIMVDEFTLENGATYILSGSHHHPDPPTADFFFRHAERITGPVGSIVLFDSRVWHAAGENLSARTRYAMTLSFSRPFMKPQLDYARLLGEERGAKLSEAARQLIGYNARVPVSLDEWYKPRDQRFYRADQG